MNEGVVAEQARVTFADLVKEAFIDPIRSVLIIDDQYPTLEKIFSEEGYNPADQTQRWTAKDQILKVVQQFRKKSPALMVDIHDGEDNEGIGSYLHQSDLLVLDYQLEQTSPYGARATEIIADLLRNNHFNLVMIHTAIGDLIDPFNTILMSLLTPLKVSEGRTAEGLALITDFEDAGHERVVDEIKDALNASAYVALRAHLLDGEKPVTFLNNAPEMERFREIAEGAGWDTGERLKVMDWGMSVHDQRVAAHNASLRDLRWSVPGGDKKAWIRTNGGFIAFADKQNTNLLDILQSAIEEWRPSPSRLMSARIRAEISLQGAGAEDSALSDKHAHWHYYQELRRPPQDDSPQAAKSHRKTLLEGYVTHHTERLLDLIGSKAVAFGLKVLEADPTENDSEDLGFSGHYAVKATLKKEREKALEHYNAHISTKPVSGWHLQPGHIFKVGQEMWVCLSPSCDLVPMQKPSAAVKNSSEAAVKPFLAVKLTHQPKYNRPEVNSNRLIFLKEVNAIKTYSAYPTADEFGSPIWRLFMASDYGKFEVKQDRTAELNLSFLHGKNNAMQLECVKARIVGQLRYEYALNLIQKLGVEFTRVGLDFAAPSE